MYGLVSNMRLNEKFVSYDMAGELLLVPCGEAADKLHGFARCNETSAFIVNCLKTETTESEIVDKLEETYEGEREVFASNVSEIIEKLRSIGALIE